ncbi:MAG: hypothetical protein ACFCUL_04615 [Flavobacteriaceae bacterium]
MTTESIIDVKGHSDGSIEVILKDLGIASTKRGNSYIVFCPSLKVLGYSNRSEREAFRDFEKNLIIFFDVHLKRNTLNEALISFDWIKDNTRTSFGAKNDSPSLTSKDFNFSLAAA